MPFDPTPVFQDPRWKDVQADPTKLEKAQSKLFEQYVASDPSRKDYFDRASPEDQSQLRREFGERMKQKYADAFSYEASENDSSDVDEGLTGKVKRSVARGFGRIGRSGASVLDAVDDYLSTVENNLRGRFWGLADRIAPELMERKRQEAWEGRIHGEIVEPKPRMIDEAGDSLWDWSTNFIEENKEALPRAPLAEDPSQLLDVSWWAENLPEQAVYYVPAVLTGLLSGGSTTVAGLTAGLLESGEDYTALKEEGVKADEAFARTVIGVSAISMLNRAGFEPVFKKGGGNAIRRALTRFVAEGSTEYIEEPVQLATKDIGRVSSEEFQENLAQTLIQALDVIPLAGVSGSAGGFVTDLSRSKTSDENQTAASRPEPAGDQNEAVAAEGVTDDKSSLLDEQKQSAPPAQLDEVQFPVVEVPVDSITLSKDVPNFKEDANLETGEVRGKELHGLFDRRGTGPIIVWERENGSTEVISGRHRLALAKRSGEKTIPAQVVRESEGFDQSQAMVLDAELNIRDGQGTARDYADYFRNREEISFDEARQANLLRDAKGYSGWHIGKGSSDDLYAAYRAGKISEPKAAAIGELAPGDPAVQAAVMKDARKLSIQDLREYTKSLTAAPRAEATEADQGDLFGFDNSVLDESKQISKQASKAINQIAEQERTLRQAISRGDRLELTTAQAKRLGITDKKDPEQLRAALEKVKSERAKLERWHTNTDLMNRFREEAGLPIIGKREDTDFQPLETEEQLLELRDFLEGEPLAKLTGNEFDFTDRSILQHVSNWFKERFNGHVVRPGMGDVLLAKSGVKAVINKGLSRNKAIAFAAVPSVIENGKIISKSDNYKDGEDRVVIAGPVSIGEEKHVIIVTLKMDENSKRYYLHNVYDKEWGSVSLKTGAENQHSGLDTEPHIKVLQRVFDVKRSGGQKPGTTGVEGNIEGMAGGASNWPGGPLQSAEAGAPLQTADDRMAALPVEMPEMVQIYKGLTRGQYPRIQKGMTRYLGLFRHSDGPMGEGTITLRADIFDLVTPQEKLRIREKAEADAKAMAEQSGEPVNVNDLYEHRVQQAYDDAATKNPVSASKVMAHELMHFVDWLPDKTLKRGNLLGHVAAFKGYLMKSLADVQASEATALTKNERAKLRRIAQKEVGKRPADPEARKAWGDQVSKVYTEKVEQAMQERGLLSLAQIKAELEPLIAWWRGTETMEDYFKPATEMFAEAGSIFLNNPAAMRKRAPKYYSALMGWMSARPEWQKRYNQLQDDIKSGKVNTDRVKNLRGSVLDATETAAQLERVANSRTMRERWDAFLYTFHRQFGPVYSRLKKVDNPNQVWKTKKAVSDYLYRKAHHELYLGRIRNEVMAPLLDANLDSVDMFEYMFHQHVVNNRQNIANPYGWTTKASSERLQEMRDQFGEDRFNKLADAQQAFWKVRQEEVLNALDRAGVFDQETMGLIRERQFYATINPVKGKVGGDPDSIAAKIQARYGVVVGGIYKQTGYMGDIKNPFLATMEKDLALLNMAYREPAKRTISEVLRSSEVWNKEWHPAEWIWTGSRREPVNVSNGRVGTLYYLNNGKLEAWYGPRALVDQFMFGDAIEANLMAKFAHHMSRHFQNLWTQLNYGFWPVAYTRDVGAFRDQMPGATRFGKRSYLHYRKRAIAAGKSSVLGRPNEDAKRSLDKKDLITHPDPRGDSPNETPVDQLMRQYHIEPVNWRGDQPGRANAIMRTLKHWWEVYKSWGQVRERAVKIAGRMYLEDHYPDMPEARKSEIIHEMSGSPDFLQKGAGNVFLNGLFPFWNPIKEGVYSGLKSMKQRPLESFYKFMKYTILPLVGLEALRRGLLNDLLGDDQSEELSDMLNSIPRYDWDNYKVIPLGWADKSNKKVLYLRIPMHERERVMRGAFAKLLRADEDPANMETLVNVAGGQIPGLNPLVKVGAAWYTYKSSGRAPVDMYTGIQIMSDDQALARRGDPEMLRFTANNLGASIFVRFDKRPLDAAEPTWMEKVLRLPIVSNSLGRWVKVSNRGVTDRLEPVTESVEKRRAQTRLDAQEAIRDVLAGDRLSPEQMMRMVNDPYYAEYFKDKMKDSLMMREGTPEMRAILEAPSKESQMAIMQELLAE